MFIDFNADYLGLASARKDRIVSSGGHARSRALLSEIRSPIIRLLPYPLLFSAQEFGALHEAALRILSAQKKLVSHLCATRSRQDILAMFQMDEEAAAYVDWEEFVEGRRRVARVDLLPLRDGYAVCELNFSAGVGGGDVYDCYRAFADSMGWPASRRDVSPFENLAKIYRAALQHLSIDRLILLDWSSHAALGYPSVELPYRYLSKAFPDLDISIHDENSYPRELLSPGSGRGTLIHRNFTFDDVTVNRDVFKRIKGSGAVFSNGLEAEMLMSKAWLSLLWKESTHALLTVEEIAAIKAYVPYSFSPLDQPLEETLSRKDELIFKVNHSYGGAGILVGREYDRGELKRRLLEKGLENWTCQRFHDVPLLVHACDEISEPAGHKTVLGLYVHGQLASGIVVRSSRGGTIVNAGSGARAGWATVVDEEEKQAIMALLEG